MKRIKLYYTDWCNSCTKLKPVIRDLESRFSNVIFEYLDMDSITEFHTIKSIPTVVFERDGIEVKRLTGLQSKYAYEYELKRL